MSGKVIDVLEKVYEARILARSEPLTSFAARQRLGQLVELGDDFIHSRPFLGSVLDHARDQRFHEPEIRVLLHNDNVSSEAAGSGRKVGVQTWRKVVRIRLPI